MAKTKRKAKPAGKQKVTGKKPAAKKQRKAPKRAEAGATISFVAKDGSTLATMSLSGAAARLHESPAQVKKLMDLLELPKGTDARVFTEASTVIVR